MSEISYYDADLEETIHDLEESIRKLKAMKSGKSKMELIEVSRQKLKAAQDLKKGYHLALRQLTDRSDVRFYKEKLEMYTKSIEKVADEMKQLTAETDRQSMYSRDSHEEPMDNQQMLQQTVKTQEKIGKSLDNTRRMVQQSKEIAVATTERLVEQTDQLNRVQDEVNRMDDILSHANKLVRVIARRMATDRVILTFAFFIFLGIVAIVIFSIVDEDQQMFNVPEEAKPPSPKSIRASLGA